MATKITGAETDFKCPHCGEEMEAPVGDFVIPGHIGDRSIANEQLRRHLLRREDFRKPI